ncbi:MAG: hypothetical protein EP330_20435 [Deltaproteobacteria bacterium]|nr:MAG: hypothetical protein EP330_20435 [Deltaproteobacteria bacterium]
MRPNWFVGLAVDGDGWFASVPEPPRGLRRFHPDDLHFTVAFLGAVDEAQALAAWSVLTESVDFAVTLGTVVPMGPKRRYSALSAMVGEGREPLEAWMRRWQAPLLEAAGAAPPRHGVKAHCTLARPMRRASDAARTAGLRWAEALEVGHVRVRLDEVALYTWDDERRTRLFRKVRTR